MIRPLRSLVVAAAVVGMAACRKDKPAADSGLSQDLALANQVQQPVTPTLQDTAISPVPTPQPRAPQRAPQRAPARLPENPTVRPVAPPPPAAPPVQAPMSRPAPEPVVAAPGGGGNPGSGSGGRDIAAGTALTVASGTRVCTNSNRPGDKLVATLGSAVAGNNGAVIPAGSTVVLEVASVTPGDTPDDARITFRLRSVVINNVPHAVSGDVTTLGTYDKVQIPSAPGADKKKVIGGAIAGAIAGKILGGSNKGAVIGGAAGAAAGAVAAKAGQKYEACLPEGAPLRVVLADRLVLGG